MSKFIDKLKQLNEIEVGLPKRKGSKEAADEEGAVPGEDGVGPAEGGAEGGGVLSKLKARFSKGDVRQQQDAAQDATAGGGDVPEAGSAGTGAGFMSRFRSGGGGPSLRERLPKLEGRGGGSGLKDRLPKEGFVADLLADLQNRRLVPVILLLVLATIAVPLLLGGTDAEEVPVAVTSSAALGPDDLDATVPAVLTEAPELRDYRKRLDAFKRKNPFRQQLTGPPKRIVKQIKREQAQQRQQESSSSAGGESAPAAPSSSSAPVGSGSAGSSPSPPAPKPAEPKPDPSPPEGGLIRVSYDIDVRVGPRGNTRKKNNLEPLEFLPNKTTRVFNYLQPNFEGTEAVFTVSPDTTDHETGGKCDPSPERCEVVTLQQGDEIVLRYIPNGKVYRLKLTNIERRERLVPASEVEGLRSEELRYSFED